jgi:hypothetical protein
MAVKKSSEGHRQRLLWCSFITTSVVSQTRVKRIWPQQLNLFPFEALKEAVRKIQKPKIAEINLGVLAYLEA